MVSIQERKTAGKNFAKIALEIVERERKSAKIAEKFCKICM